MTSRVQGLVFSGVFAVAGLQCKSSDSAPSRTPDDFSAAQAPPPASGDGTGEPATPAETQPTKTPSTASSAGTWSEGAPFDGTLEDAAKQREAAQRSAEQAAAAGREQTAELSDAHIVAITGATNNAEIEQGQLASKKAKDARVRDFAAMMVDHHSTAQREQQELSVEPAPNADARRLEDAADEALVELRKKSGREFDQAYLRLQIDEHRKVLRKLNDELLPAAKNARLKAYLEEIKPQVESHLAQAERLQQELGSATSWNDPGDRPVISNERGRAARISNR